MLPTTSRPAPEIDPPRPGPALRPPPRPQPPRSAAHPAAATAPRAPVLAAPRRPLDIVLLTLTRDGEVADPRALDTLARRVPAVTDVLVFVHGWRYDAAEARQEALRFFARLEGVLAPLGPRVVPLRVALHWPSRPFAGDTRHPAPGGLWPALEATVHAAAPDTRRRRAATRRPALDLGALLRDLATTEVPLAPEDALERAALLRRLGRAVRGGDSLLSPFQALSFWVMKRRAHAVGERVGREVLAPLWSTLRDWPRLHLVGHSFGAKLVTAAVLGGARPRSLTLLQGAFSAYAFAPSVPGTGQPGLYHRVLAEPRVDGPIAVLHSRYDTALGTLYPLVTGPGELDRQIREAQAAPDACERRARREGGRRDALMRDVVAGSALGAVGARGLGAPDLGLEEVTRIGLPHVPLVNVDGSAVLRAQEPVLGAHRDLDHPEVAALVLLAGGLLAPSATGLRPPPLDPTKAP